MSSGACRALVALLLTLTATVGLSLPAVAEEERLTERSEVEYTVKPRTGEIDVSILIKLRPNSNSPFNGRYGPIVIEEGVAQADIKGAIDPKFTDLPGPWRAMTVRVPRIEPGSSGKNLNIRYTLDGNLDVAAGSQDTPARVSTGYVYVCVPGQDADNGIIQLKIDSRRDYNVAQSGTTLSETDQGLVSASSQRPRELFTCVEATRDQQLESGEFVGPAGQEIKLHAWPGGEGWLAGAESQAQPTLEEIRLFLRHDIPGEAPVIIRQAPRRLIGGYASAHDTPGIVQLDERAGALNPEHELAHTWFTTDNFLELWLREGMAEWTATAMQDRVCAPVEGNTSGVELADWKVVQPNANPATIDQQILDQEAAACGVVSAMASRMSEDAWFEVIGSMINGETKYIGSSGPGVASTSTVNYREWLDAVDERGLVPAAKADPAFAANLEDLDFAQNLLDELGADVEVVQLQARSAARTYYHEFLDDAAPMSAPLAVRKAMDDWRFGAATQALDKSYEVWNALQETMELLPEIDIFPIIAPGFEAAASEAEIDAVLDDTLELLSNATGVVPSLGELQNAKPADWKLPAAVDNALSGQRWDDAMSSITPALAVVQGIAAADAALPQAGLMDRFRVGFETATTASELDEMASDVASIRRAAERAGRDLSLLQAEVGKWQIPSAVTDPLESGQLSSGLAILEDARAVVSAARAADIALPEAELSSETRPLFEAVTSGAGMAALRTQAEERRDQAESIGGALDSLDRRVPDWEIPDLIQEPIRARDFVTAAAVASAAQRWIDNAWEADQKLPDIDAIGKTRANFEAATELADLEAGGNLAEAWNIAANDVAEALAVSREPRGLLADLGLWGVDYQTTLDEALAAIIVGEVATARNNAGSVIDTLNSAGSSGGLRLAGIVFLGVAIVGVLGLWLMLRREAGPPWARSSTPHWVEKKPKRLGSGKDKSKGKDKGK
jgi:hypothetical protein